MRLMPVLEVPIVPIIVPFVDVAHVSDGVWMEATMGIENG